MCMHCRQDIFEFGGGGYKHLNKIETYPYCVVVALALEILTLQVK